MSKHAVEKNKITVLKWLFLSPVILYQKVLSPFLPPRCRFHPSCSVYAKQAICEHHLLTGLWLTGKRLVKCHPWHDGGLDPVPPKNKESTQ